MRLLPYHTEMLILPLSEKDIRERLYTIVYPLSPNQPMAAGKEERDFLFNGEVRKDAFRISLRVKHSNSFLPLVKGKVEETRSGSILHLSYALFPSTRLFLWFAIGVALLTAVAFMLQKEYVYGGLAIISGLFCYIVARVSFKRALRDSRSILLPALE